jgi:hypothetical protein
MIVHFQYIVNRLIELNKGLFIGFDLDQQSITSEDSESTIYKRLNTAFILTLAGEKHPKFEAARNFLKHFVKFPKWGEVANFYLNGIDLVCREIETICRDDGEFSSHLENLSEWISNEDTVRTDEIREKLWSVFFPEGVGLIPNWNDKVEGLREKRTVTIARLNNDQINDTGRQIIFTSNVLLTVPFESMPTSELECSDGIKSSVREIMNEPQLYWYDHPIPIGIKKAHNEIIYGLSGLDKAVEFERDRGNIGPGKLICIVSVSVTHEGLQQIAKTYLRDVLSESEGLNNLEVYAFTEADTKTLIREVLLPACNHYLVTEDAERLLSMIGVDGEYGRHYSFLKAIAAFWKVLINTEVEGTFKIDLDQVFPQKELVEQTGASAFEHLSGPLWGAHGIDWKGQSIELGMIAGALVNRQDIGNGLFTPDVVVPGRELKADEYVFFSVLPQALSAEGEMMTRYRSGELDGRRACVQRIHVTGGVSGILVDALRRHRPFTPSFIGRAEDQAYILSVLFNVPEGLRYVHRAGFFMRHDKEVFIREAIERFHVGKLIGDYVRILNFSAYARDFGYGFFKCKDEVDPFTGCFISRIPISVVYLRFCLKAASFFKEGEQDQGIEFINVGVSRIGKTLDFIKGPNSQLQQTCKSEREGWNLYYDILSVLETALNERDEFALNIKEIAKDVINQCSLNR